MKSIVVIRSIFLGIFALFMLLSLVSFTNPEPSDMYGVVQDYDTSLSDKLIGKWTLVKKVNSEKKEVSLSAEEFQKIVLNFNDNHRLKIVKQVNDTTVGEIKNTQYKIRLETTRNDAVRKYIMVEREWGIVEFKQDTLILDYSYINQPKEYYSRQ